MFIFAAAFQQNTLIMSTTASEATAVEVVPPNAMCDKPKKKFQVVPVPGEFTRGRWKVIDTRFGSAMGEFGNYPPDDEYKMIVTHKNNVITVRKKFPRPPSVPDIESEEVDSIRVLQKSQPRFDQVPVTNQIKILIMDPETAAVAAENIAGAVIEGNNVALTGDMTTSQTAVALMGGDSTKVDDSAKLATATSNTVVAIDNKIVQAMDLVKTHLTFAVREEVETLRTTITDLEARLNALREENRLLRENVSPDVLAFITANKQICE